MKVENCKKCANVFGTTSKLMALGALITFCIGEVFAWRVDKKQQIKK